MVNTNAATKEIEVLEQDLLTHLEQDAKLDEEYLQLQREIDELNAEREELARKRSQLVMVQSSVLKDLDDKIKELYPAAVEQQKASYKVPEWKREPFRVNFRKLMRECEEMIKHRFSAEKKLKHAVSDVDEKISEIDRKIVNRKQWQEKFLHREEKSTKHELEEEESIEKFMEKLRQDAEHLQRI
ncbi:MAG: hypothetical protein GY861_01935 [bacterium]|nr:hypothetical protein [bacterium]